MDYPEGVVQYWGACKLCRARTFIGTSSDTCTKCKLGKSEPGQAKPEQIKSESRDEQEAITISSINGPETPARTEATPEVQKRPKRKPKAKEVSKAKVASKATPEAKEGPGKGPEASLLTDCLTGLGWQWDDNRRMWIIKNEKGRVIQSKGGTKDVRPI